MANILSNLRFSRSSKIFITLIILALIITPTSFYLIKRNQVSADVLTQNQSTLNQTRTPLAADLAKKEGVLTRVDNPSDLSALPTAKPQDFAKSNTLIVKMKDGQDVKKIQTILTQQNNIEAKKIIIKNINPLVTQQTFDGKVQQSIKLRPQNKDLITANASKIKLNNIYLIETQSQQNIDVQLARIKSNPAVEYAQVNHKVTAQMVPNDPYYYSSSGSWGQPYDDLWGLKKIQTEEAWDNSQGENIIVAVTDTGIDYNHEDLSANIWTNSGEIPNNHIDDDNNGYVDDTKGWDFYNNDNDPMDGFGHGTHVAGTIAAVGNNNTGVIGVAPKAKLMALKGLDDSGSGYDSDLAMAIIYAANNGAKVINASWGGTGDSPILKDAVNYAHDIIGSVFVAAAGNNNSDLANDTPCNLDNAIAVSSTDQDDLKSDFSNWGNKLDISAPGGGSTNSSDTDKTYINILSTRAGSTDMYGDGEKIVGEKYYRARGTSMATPHVSGVASLIFSLKPTFSPRIVEKILYNSADDLGATGWDKYYGNGRVNARKAVDLTKQAIADTTPPSRPTKLTAKAVHTRKVNLAWVKSSDNIFVVGYKIYRNGIEIADISDSQTSYSDTGLTQGTLYKYQVKTYDANNLSSAAKISITTPTDNIPPTAPANLSGLAFSDRVELKWNTSTDNLYLAGYKVYRDGVEIADLGPSVLSYSDYQVITGSNYNYTVKAYDSEINLSNASNIITLTIPGIIFVNSNISLQGLYGGAKAAWGDYDNDGDLDLAYVGRTSDNVVLNLVKIYRNDGNDQFTDISTLGNNNFPDVSTGSFVWGDYDNDGDLDLAINGTNFNITNYGITSIYRNDGNSQFSLYTNLQSLYWGNVDWGDVNNDGFLDLVVTGGQWDIRKSNLFVYYNRNGVISESDRTILEGYRDGDLKLIDYDNDGDLDITAYGYAWNNSKFHNYFEIYINDGQGQFTDNNRIPLDTTIDRGNSDALGFAWGDYDNDGDLDVIISGIAFYSDNNYHTVIYNNNSKVFSKVFDLANLQMNPQWGDYDNDGDLDVAMNGNNFLDDIFGANQAKVFRNNGQNSFNDIGSEIPNIGGSIYYAPGGSTTWGDYDNDGDLDLFISGDTGLHGGIEAIIMKNLTADTDHFNKPNQKPTPPTNLSSKVSGNTITFAWSSGKNGRSDTETPEPGLYYNFRLGTTSGGQQIVSGTNGTPLLGNYLRPKFTAWLSPRLFGRKINNLPSGRYYWSVQTIDSGLKTSDWSTVKILNVP